MFAATSKGVYESEDKGMTWASKNAGLDSTSSHWDITIVGSSIFVANNKSVFRSNNNGNTWVKVNSGMSDFPEIQCLIAVGSNLYVGTYYSMYRSTNNGDSWNDLMINRSVSSIVSQGSTLIAGTDEGVFTSNLNGSIWKAANEGFGILVKSVYKLEILGTNVFLSNNALNSEIWKRSFNEMKTGVDQTISDHQGISIFPNPSRGIFTLISELNLDEVIIQNLYGETVYTSENLVAGLPLDMDLSDFSKGLYYVFVRQNGIESVKKIILD